MEHLHHHMHQAPLHLSQSLELASLLSMLSYSFFMSFHCVLMCGPLVCSVLARRSKITLPSIAVYNFTRLLTYTAVGGLLGFLSEQLGQKSELAGTLISWTIGGLLCLWSIGMILKIFVPHESRVSLISIRIINLVKHVQTNQSSFLAGALLGMITVILPCMTLTPALAAASASGSALNGALLMFAFGLGTFVAMFLGPGLSSALLQRIPKRGAEIFSAMFLFVAGVLTILRSGSH